MFYRDSKGEEHVIAEMNPAKLINAHKAMKRDGWNVEKFDSQEDHDRALVEMERCISINRGKYREELLVELETADADRSAKIRETLERLDAEDAEASR